MITTNFDKRFAVPSYFDFFKHPVYPYELKEYLIVRLQLNSLEKVTFCGEDTVVTYKLSDICSLQDLLLLYFDKRDDFANQNHRFYNPTIKPVLATINGMSHHLFVAGISIDMQ